MPMRPPAFPDARGGGSGRFRPNRQHGPCALPDCRNGSRSKRGAGMAKTRNWGTGRDCLLAGPDGTLSQAIARGLATASFTVHRAVTEAEALAALEQQPFA